MPWAYLQPNDERVNYEFGGNGRATARLWPWPVFVGHPWFAATLKPRSLHPLRGFLMLSRGACTRSRSSGAIERLV